MHCKDPTVFPFSSTRINWVRMHQYILYIVNLHFLRYPSVWTWLMKVDLLQGWARLAKDGFFRFGSSPLPFFSSGRRASIMSWLHRCISSLSVFFNSRYRRSELVDTSGIQSEFFALNILIFRGFCVLLFVYLRLDQVEVIPSFGVFFCFVCFCLVPSLLEDDGKLGLPGVHPLHLPRLPLEERQRSDGEAVA